MMTIIVESQQAVMKELWLNNENSLFTIQSGRMEILFQDEYFVAVNKPAGLLVHPTRIDFHEKRTLTGLLTARLNRKIWVIHRLDKPVSGVIFLGLSTEAAKRGAEMFSDRQVEKKYLAMVRGYSQPTGVIDHPLSTITDRLTGNASKNTEARKKAITRFRCLAKTEVPVSINRYPASRYSLLEVFPKTGRTHQIRRHLKQIKHPIIGDTKYGDHRHNRYFKERWELEHLLLSAIELIFRHPFTEELITIRADVNQTFKRIAIDLGLEEGLKCAISGSDG